MDKVSEKEKWRNLVQYISACMDLEEDTETLNEATDLNDKMYMFLMENYKISRKPKKFTIAGIIKPKANV